MDTSQTTNCFDEPGDFLKTHKSSMVPPRTTGFYT